MKNKWILSVVVCLVVVSSTGIGAVTVAPVDDGAVLAQTILGSGVTISNVSYIGSSGASGTFTNGLATGIGIGSGILLTSGQAVNASGSNTSDGITGANGMAGDASLNTLVPGYSTYDATVLEFDFQSAGGDVYFNYMFGSDEYDEWTNSSYNDVFGFFLDGQNIALIPGTTTPVSINNVNMYDNPGYYNDNDMQTMGVPTPYDFEYDGFTDVFTAQALGLSAGSHHIKLAIADAGDTILDSGVFIQSGTFSDTPTPPATVPVPGALPLAGLGLGMFGWLRRKRAL